MVINRGSLCICWNRGSEITSARFIAFEGSKEEDGFFLILPLFSLFFPDVMFQPPRKRKNNNENNNNNNATSVKTKKDSNDY
mmetsp:Transcript_1339/g.4172  ORF Transcript_1339/g.4172 Transcript_1339/m.4172 type:complete len:82 (+) Transcript_1339:398-643(+)